MKKILAIFICIFLVCTLPIVAFAEEVSDTVDAVVTETPTVDTEGDITGEESTPEAETAPEPSPEEYTQTTSEMVVEYIKMHLEELSVIVTLLLTIFYNVRKHKVLNKSIGVMNNNAIAVAENSKASMDEVRSDVGDMSLVVGSYRDEIVALLAEIRNNAEEKKKLEELLEEVHTHLKASKLANVEFANELAELLVLANIPNSKKDELYARHRAAVDAISLTEEKATLAEVNTDDSKQKE
jgi:hypothetical protein